MECCLKNIFNFEYDVLKDCINVLNSTGDIVESYESVDEFEENYIISSDDDETVGYLMAINDMNNFKENYKNYYQKGHWFEEENEAVVTSFFENMIKMANQWLISQNIKDYLLCAPLETYGLESNLLTQPIDKFINDEDYKEEPYYEEYLNYFNEMIDDTDNDY